jgi:hypothetical protein
MQLNGSGKVAVNYARVAGVKTYAVAADVELTQIVGIKYTARATDGTSAVVQHGVCSRHIATTVNTNYRNCYMAQVSRGTGNNTVKILRGGAELATVTATTTVGTEYVLTLKVVPNGASTTITASLWTASTWNSNDPETGTSLASCTASDSTSALQSLGNWGLVNLGQYLTTPDWDIEEAYLYTELDDTEGPALVGAAVSPDGKTIICEFAEATLPLVVSGGSAPSVDGLTVQARPLRTGAWTTYTQASAVILTDPIRGARYVKIITNNVIPAGYDVQVGYSRTTGNLFDSVSPTPIEAQTLTIYAGNYSKIGLTARTGDVDRILGTRGWLRVTTTASSTGKEAQTVREIVLPYGCSADGITLVYEGFSGSAEVVKILGAGVRAVAPDGTVTTHTLSFSGSGTPTIAPGAAATATIAQAFVPGTKLFVTTWYKENSNGLLPQQWSEPLTEPHAGSYDGNAAEVGNVGALTSKILLGGTSGGPTHTAASPLFAGADNRSQNYNVSFVYGKPYEYYSGVADAFGCVGNSTMIHTAVAYSVPDRAFGDHNDPINCIPYITFGVGGATQTGFFEALEDSAATIIALGTNEATCKVNWSLDGYGHNEARSNGRDAGGSAYGPQTIATLLWTNAEAIAGAFSTRGTSHIKWDLTPIERDPWLAWNASDDPMAQVAIGAFNRLLAQRYDALPAAGFVLCSAIGAASYNGSFAVGQDAITTITNDAQGYENDLWATGSGTDGIHAPAGMAYAVALATRAEYQRLRDAGTGGGSGSGGGAGSLINGGLIR